MEMADRRQGLEEMLRRPDGGGFALSRRPHPWRKQAFIVSTASRPHCGRPDVSSFVRLCVRPDRWTALLFWNKLWGTSRARRKATRGVRYARALERGKDRFTSVLRCERPPRFTSVQSARLRGSLFS